MQPNSFRGWNMPWLTQRELWQHLLKQFPSPIRLRRGKKKLIFLPPPQAAHVSWIIAAPAAFEMSDTFALHLSPNSAFAGSHTITLSCHCTYVGYLFLFSPKMFWHLLDYFYVVSWQHNLVQEMLQPIVWKSQIAFAMAGNDISHQEFILVCFPSSYFQSYFSLQLCNPQCDTVGIHRERGIVNHLKFSIRQLVLSGCVFTCKEVK